MHGADRGQRLVRVHEPAHPDARQAAQGFLPRQLAGPVRLHPPPPAAGSQFATSAIFARPARGRKEHKVPGVIKASTWGTSPGTAVHNGPGCARVPGAPSLEPGPGSERCGP
ncbi:hypothetical protein GCM10017566_26800 [Amycolatopsis bartoniae]|uniref:Uncharacterized protein n=1 Tax=Amycolatopsis bartoniae TaxID=941986 RepID=A0A8H9IWD9_9PSEU|nr:hypothetical protein GCM10017566_26800 [Amycolatopsis bartoniae]